MIHELIPAHISEMVMGGGTCRCYGNVGNTLYTSNRITTDASCYTCCCLRAVGANSWRMWLHGPLAVMPANRLCGAAPIFADTGIMCA